MLTKRQKQIFDYIKLFIEKHGYSPSFEEIKKHLKLSSVSTVHFHIAGMEKAGLIKKGKNEPRAIEIQGKDEELISIPLLGTIAAGQPIESIESRDDVVAVPGGRLPRSGKLYALKVKGNSMVDEDIHNDDIIIVKSQPSFVDGEKVVALVNNSEVTLKKIYRDQNRIRLQPANQKYPPIYVDPDNVIVQGSVVTVIKTFERINTKTPVSTPLSRSTKKGLQNALLDMPLKHKFPSTRFQGSKTKLLDKIWDSIKNINFKTAFDVFGGTGSVGYMLKSKGKQVFYNDYLKFNYLSGAALIENNYAKLEEKDTDFILSIHSNIEYPNFIQNTFKDIYFTDQENKWLDIVSTNIRQIKDKYKQALAFYALFQSCLVKRPFNLFHRKNLYVRLANVKRSFGNKATWEKPFEEHFIKFVEEANQAVFDNGENNRAFNFDAFEINEKADLVYVDTPYISVKGGCVDYIDFYHFLEGLCNYQEWYSLIDYSSKHLKFKNNKSLWSDPNQIKNAFDKLFRKFRDSILVVSYRSDGIPSPEELQMLMRRYKNNVKEVFRSDYQYVLSKNGDSKEILLIGQ